MDDVDDDDLVFVKKFPLYPRERLRKSAKENDDVVFVKNLPLNLRESFKKSAKENDNDDIISTKSSFTCQGRIANKKKQIARGNLTAIKSNFDFDPGDYLNKPLVFDMEKTREEKILERIIEKLPSDNN